MRMGRCARVRGSADARMEWTPECRAELLRAACGRVLGRLALVVVGGGAGRRARRLARLAGVHHGAAAERARGLQVAGAAEDLLRARPRRLAGEGERMLDLLLYVRLAGSWKRYSNVPRLALLVLQKLCWRRRAAAPPGLLARLFPQEPQGRRRKRRTVEAPAIEELEATSGCKVTRPRTRKDAYDAAPLVLPDELFWKCLSFWRSARDPDC